MKIKIAIAEDNHFLMKSIVEKLSFFDNISIKIKAKNGAELIGKLEENYLIDVILMDIQMPEIDGIKATELIKKKHPQIKIIMLTVVDDDEFVFKAIKAGASGYLLKEIDAQKLNKSIIEVLDGGAPMTPTIALKTLNLLRKPEINFSNSNKQDEVELTKRENEILTQLSKGLNYQFIAENLIISPSTVRKHIENIYKKLEVHNKMEAVQKAQKKNII